MKTYKSSLNYIKSMMKCINMLKDLEDSMGNGIHGEIITGFRLSLEVLLDFFKKTMLKSELFQEIKKYYQLMLDGMNNIVKTYVNNNGERRLIFIDSDYVAEMHEIANILKSIDEPYLQGFEKTILRTIELVLRNYRLIDDVDGDIYSFKNEDVKENFDAFIINFFDITNNIRDLE